MHPVCVHEFIDTTEELQLYWLYSKTPDLQSSLDPSHEEF